MAVQTRDDPGNISSALAELLISSVSAALSEISAGFVSAGLADVFSETGKISAEIFGREFISSLGENSAAAADNIFAGIYGISGDINLSAPQDITEISGNGLSYYNPAVYDIFNEERGGNVSVNSAGFSPGDIPSANDGFSKAGGVYDKII